MMIIKNMNSHENEAKKNGQFNINLKKMKRKNQTEVRKREWNFDSANNSDEEMLDNEPEILSDDELKSCSK